MRLFAAVQPPSSVLVHLENALAVVGGPGAAAHDAGRAGVRSGGLRWTPPEDRHVTLAFFGEVPEGYLDDVAQGLDDVARRHAPFAAALRGAGLFDGRTLWVGCTGDAWAPLMADACRLGTDLLGRAEDHRSRPHLTIARTTSGRRPGGRRGSAGERGSRRADAGDPRAGMPSGVDPAALAHALALYAGPAWTVGEIVLVSSRLGAGSGGSPLHDVVHRSALPAVAG